MIITISLFHLRYKTNIVGKYCNHWLTPMRRSLILLFCHTIYNYYNHIYHIYYT